MIGKNLKTCSLFSLILLHFINLIFSQNGNFESGLSSNTEAVLFDRALSLQKNEAILKDYVESGILREYLTAGYEVDTAAIMETYLFYSQPFDTTYRPQEKAIEELKYLIRKNTIRKKNQTDEISYEFLKICYPDLPENYQIFLENEFIILHNEMLICMEFESSREKALALIESGIVEIFYDKGVISEELAGDMEALKQTYQTHRDSLQIPDAPIRNSWLRMQEEIEINQALKAEVPQRLYGEFRRCDRSLPLEYDVFLEETKIVLDQAGADCFLKRIPQKDRISISKAWATITQKERSKSDSSKDVGSDFDDFGDDDWGEDEFGFEEEVKELPPSKPIPLTSAKGIFPTTALIDATAQFLVERTKEELILSFFDQFQRRIDEIPELRHLFSNTYSLLLNREFFHIPTLGKSWKTAFERDIRDLPLSLERMINESPNFLFLKKRSDYKIFLLAFHFEDWYTQSNNPSIYILDRFLEINQLDGGSFLDSALAVVKHNLHDFRTKPSYPHSWYGRSYTEKLDKRGEELFIALQYQKEAAYYENFLLGNGKSYAMQMKAMPNKIYKLEQEILSELQGMDTHLKGLKIPKNPKGDSLNREAQLLLFSDYLYEKEQKLRLAADGLNSIQKIAYKLKYPDDPEALLADQSYQGSSQLIYAASQLIPAIESRSPSKIFVHSLQALQPLFQIAAVREEGRIRNLYTHITQNRSDTAEVNELNKRISKSLNRQKQLEASSKYLAFYGGFMLDVFYAKTAPEIKGLLYKYALPAGSFRIKRRSQLSLELGAYPNLYVGREFIVQSEGVADGMVAGVSAPIGISVSWPIRKSINPFEEEVEEKLLKKSKLKGSAYSGQSFSLFFPVIDIGAPFSYRWTNGNDVGFPDEIRWQQILAPGIYAIWGMKNKPISLSLGGQYVPKLRSITSAGSEISEFDTFRIGLNLAVDIPIFSLFRR